MTNDKKKRLAEAFDKGELPEQNGPEELSVAAYARRLHAVERALHQAPKTPLPAGFVRMVMNRLPAPDVALRRILGIRDVLLPLLLLSALAMSFLFADFLGFAPLVRTVSNGLSSTSGNSLQIGFIAMSAFGILFASWFIVSSFFGIRSRRIVR